MTDAISRRAVLAAAAGLVAASMPPVALGAQLAAAVASNAAEFVVVAPAAELGVEDKPIESLLVEPERHSLRAGYERQGDRHAGSRHDGRVRRARVGRSERRRLEHAEVPRMPLSQMAAAFQTGRIDAASVREPFLTDALKYARVLASNTQAAVGDDYVVTAWFAMAPWAQVHADVVARFASALRDPSAWSAKNGQRCVEIITRAFKLDPATMPAESLPDFPFRLTPALVQPHITVTARYGRLSGAWTRAT